jgi:hypothetical protein
MTAPGGLQSGGSADAPARSHGGWSPVNEVRESTLPAGPVRTPLLVAQIVLANAIPALGVLIAGWEPLVPMFFYWLDGLLGLLALGAAVILGMRQELPPPFSRFPWPAVPYWTALFAILWLILAIPSVLAAGFVLGALKRGFAEPLATIFSSSAVWPAVALSVAFQIGQVGQELRGSQRWELIHGAEARANLFIHRTLAMGLLAAWAGHASVGRLGLVAYVVLLSLLFTYTQLFPERWLHLVGFRRAGRGKGRGEPKGGESRDHGRSKEATKPQTHRETH